MTKIEDIAKTAGVSIATVSRVLNNSGRVAPATRNAVLRAAQQLGRSVSPEVSRKRILIAYLSSGQEMIEPMMRAAEDYNVSPLYKMVSDSLNSIDIAFDGDFDGAILIDNVLPESELAALQERMPVVECRNYGRLPGVSVLCDDVDMGYQLARHLLDGGRQRIGIVELNESINARPHATERLRGVRAALSEAGQTLAARYIYDPELVFHMDAQLLPRLRADAGRVWDALLFAEPLDGILALRDALAEDGLRFGEEIALACFDENALAQYNGLTAIRQPLESLAQGSLFLLDSLMAGRLHPTQRMWLRYQAQLLPRASSTRK